MATHAAIAATCEAIIRLLRSSFAPDDFNGAQGDFQVYVAENFNSPMNLGASLFLYRIFPNSVNRTPPGRLLPTGEPAATRLPLDLHFLLTAWAKTASLQQEIAGWMMRVLEDHPILSADLLNAYRKDVFRPDEAVEVVLAQLSDDDMFHLWEVTISRVYQLSIPYVARMVMIDSSRVTPAGGGQVQERVAGFERKRME